MEKNAVYMDKEGVFHADRKMFEEERKGITFFVKENMDESVQRQELKIKRLQEEIKAIKEDILEVKQVGKQKIAKLKIPLSDDEWSTYCKETKESLNKFRNEHKRDYNW